MISLDQIIITCRHPSELVQPRNGAFHHVAPPVTPWPFMPRKAFSLVPSILAWNTRNRAASSQTFSKSTDCVGPVSQQLSESLARPPTTPRDTDPVQDRKRQLDFIDRTSFQKTRQRRPVAIDHQPPLGSQPSSAPAHTTAPFFAGAKLPSKIPWDNFNRPRLPNCPSKTRSTRAQTPFRCQASSRRWQDVFETYSDGMSFQRQPDFNTKRIPLIVRRSSARGRPFLCRGNTGRINFHSLSDNSVSRCFKEHLPSLGGNGYSLHFIFQRRRGFRDYF